MDLSNTPSQSNGDRPQKGARTVMSTTPPAQPAFQEQKHAHQEALRLGCVFICYLLTCF